MATLRKRKRKLGDGTATYWVVDFSVTENGKTRRKQEHFRVDPAQPQRARLLAEQRKAEIDRKIARHKLSGRRSLNDGPHDVEIGDWLDAFWQAIAPNCSDSYHAIIRYGVEKFWRLMRDQGIHTTAQLRRRHFADFAEAMKAKGNKPKSIHNDLSILKRAVTWGIDEQMLSARLLRAFPSVKVPKRKRRVLSKDEIDELLAAAEGSEIREPILVALYTGARRGELVQLRRSDVDLDAGLIHFRAEIAKAGEHGAVPIHPKLRPFLEEHAGGDGHLLTRRDGTPWTRDALSRQFTALVRGVLKWPDVTFHCLRHTFGTQLAASGKISPFELQRVMRHKSITTSMIYVNLAKEELPDIGVF